MATRHAKVSAVADGPDTTKVRPSDWNAPHTFSDGLSLGQSITLTNIASAYDGSNTLKGLGMALVDFTDVNEVQFQVKVNKIGTGTQSWQLWNDTDGTQIGVIDDAGAAGEKTLSATFSSGLPTGVKRIRVRAKSTVNTDDPVYFGACCLIRRV